MTTQTAPPDIDLTEIYLLAQNTDIRAGQLITALCAEVRRLRAMLNSATATAHVAMGHDGTPIDCPALLCDAAYRLLPPGYPVTTKGT